MPDGADHQQEYIRDRAKEEGVDFSGLSKKDRGFREGREKLRFNGQFSTGETFAASENKGEANFGIIKDGKEVFNFKDLLPEGYKFTTPEHWINLDESSADAPFDFKTDPTKFRQEVQGIWQCGDKFISVGKITSLQDIVALLHEVGHSRENPAELRQAQDIGDTKREAEISSQLERKAWAEALRDVRKIKEATGANVLEGFQDADDLDKYINTNMATHRYMAELKTSGTIRNVLQMLDIKTIFGTPTINKIDNLFDKKKPPKK